MRNQPLPVILYKTLTGHEPVRKWFKGLSGLERKRVGEDLKSVQYGWPLGMPLVRKLDRDIWEIRTKLDKKIARIFITMHSDIIVVLHAFVKKSHKIPKQDIQLVRQRLIEVKEAGI